MLDPYEPKVVEYRRGVCGDLCSDGRPLVEGVGGAGAAVGLDDELNRTLAFDVDNAVSILAEYERTVNVQRLAVASLGCRIVAQNLSLGGEACGCGKGDGIGVLIKGGYGCKRVFVGAYHDFVAGDGEVLYLGLCGGVRKHEGGA